MTNKASYSVVLPVCNVEQYLPQCLDSLLQQTIAPIEIIAVNDGSTDSSGKILDAYAKTYPIITVIHQENGGLSVARNVGMQAVRKGEYLVFVDSDDFVERDFYPRLLEMAVKNNLDIAIGNGYYYHNATDKSQIIFPFADVKLANGADWYAEAVLNPKYMHVVWLQLYRRAFLLEQNILSIPGRYNQDVLWTLNQLLGAKRVGYDHRPGYYYRQRPGSVTKMQTDTQLIWQINSLVDNSFDVDQVLKEKNLSERQKMALCNSLLERGCGVFGKFKKLDSEVLKLEAVQGIYSKKYFALLWRHSRTIRHYRRVIKYYLKSWFILHFNKN